MEEVRAEGDHLLLKPEDATLNEELRVQANELLDWLVQLDRKHSEEVATLRRQLIQLHGTEQERGFADDLPEGSASGIHTTHLGTAAVEIPEAGGVAGDLDGNAGVGALVDDPLMLALGIATVILAFSLLHLARSAFLHKTARQTTGRLLVWAESHGKVPELSKAAMWSSSHASAGAAARSAGDGRGVVVRILIFLLQSTVGAILSGLLRGFSQGLFWILTLPLVGMGLFWLFKLTSRFGEESSTVQAEFASTKDASDMFAAGGKLPSGIRGMLNGMIRQILL